MTLRGVTGWARPGFARCSAVVMAVALEDRHTVRRLDVKTSDAPACALLDTVGRGLSWVEFPR